MLDAPFVASPCSTQPQADFAVTTTLNLLWSVKGVIDAPIKLPRGISCTFDQTTAVEHPFPINGHPGSIGQRVPAITRGGVVPFTPTAAMPSTICYR